MCDPCVCARGVEVVAQISGWVVIMCIYTLSDVLATLRKDLCPGTMKGPLKTSLQPQTLADGTKGQRRLRPHRLNDGPSSAPCTGKSKAPCRPPPGAWKFPVRVAFPHCLQLHFQEERQNRGRDGGGGRDAQTDHSLHPNSPACNFSCLEEVGAAHRMEKPVRMGKPVRAASSKGKCDGRGAWGCKG